MILRSEIAYFKSSWRIYSSPNHRCRRRCRQRLPWSTGSTAIRCRALVADAGSLRSPAGTGPWAAGIRQLVDARRWSVPGVYLLLWDPLADGRVPVYVGSTKDLLERLHDHEQVGWGLAIVLTGHGLRRSAAEQIERALGRGLLLADPSETAWVRRWARLPRRDPNEIPWPYVAPLILAAERLIETHSPLQVTFDPDGAAEA